MPLLPPIHRIVLATDGSPHAEAALSSVSALGWPRDAATIWVTNIVDVPVPSEKTINRLMDRGVTDWRQVMEMSHGDSRARAALLVASAAERLRERLPGVGVEEVVRFGDPAAELLVHVNDVGAELVVAGARGDNVLHGLLLGSVSEALVTSSPCSVLILREAPSAFETVLVAMRTEDDADLLAGLCLRLPFPPETRFLAVTVGTPLRYAPPGHNPFKANRLDQLLRELEEEDRVAAIAVGKRFVERIKAGAPQRTVEAKLLRGMVNPTLLDTRGDIVPAILREASEENAALIMVGARESKGLTGRLGLGSVSRKLVRRSPGAVLVAR